MFNRLKAMATRHREESAGSPAIVAPLPAISSQP